MYLSHGVNPPPADKHFTMRQISSKPQLSVWEKLDMVLKFAFISQSSFHACIAHGKTPDQELTNILISSPPFFFSTVPSKLAFNVTQMLVLAFRQKLNYRHFLLCAHIRTIFSTFSARQVQALSAPSSSVYRTWLEQKTWRNSDRANSDRLIHDVQPLLDVGDSSILWIGNRRKATKVVLFFHGGGFIAPMMPGHLEWCWNAYVMAGAEAGVEVAVAMLRYTLCPGGLPPLQLRQAAAALAEVRNAGFHPKDIIIGGDSAGGNLTLQVLGHLLHPHPEAQLVKLEEPLSAAFLVSPWVSVHTDSRSFHENKFSDMLSSEIMTGMADDSIGYGGLESQRDNGYMAPLDVDASWLNGLNTVVDSVYVTVGKKEILYDQGVRIADMIRRLNPPVELRMEEAEKEAHDFILVEGWIGQAGDATQRMKRWFTQLISES